MNFFVPRLGEVTRAITLKLSKAYPLNTTLSTIVFERAIDILCLLIILVFAFLFEALGKGALLAHFTASMQ